MKPVNLDDFRNRASTIIGVRIPPHGWKAVFNELDREGQLDNRTMIDLLTLICETLETYDELS